MSAAAGLLILALLVQQPQTYYWRDASGQTHITNTPPPRGAEILEPPPPPAVVTGKRGARLVPLPQGGSPRGHEPVVLTPAQQQAWTALDAHLAKARSEGDRRTLVAVTDSLIQDCLWGNGLWAMPALPVLSLLLMGFMGWWLALGLRPGARIPMVGGFLLLGVALGHLLLNLFLYHPQAVRLRQNLELLELHLGTGRTLSSERRALLQQRYQALEQAAEPTQAPWRFPKELRTLREAVKQVMVEP